MPFSMLAAAGTERSIRSAASTSSSMCVAVVVSVFGIAIITQSTNYMIWLPIVSMM